MKNNWAKKIKVPLEHQEYAAAYRYGAQEFEIRQHPREAQYFSTSGAHAAYQAGWARAKEEAEKEGAA